MRTALVIVSLVAVCAPCSQAAPTLTLAEDGKSAYEVLVARDATVAEKHAANEFVSFFQRVTGARLPVRNSTRLPRGPVVIVGPNEAIKAVAPDLSLDGLGADGFVIETRGPNLILAGGRSRGTLYAVYTFLEDTVGCRWWSSTVSTIPKKPTLAVSPLHDRQVPILEYREPFWADAFDGDWAVRNKANGAFEQLSEAQGGKISYKGFVHTFYLLVPPDPYFTQHPEWYSEIGGKRTCEGAQLCLTNQELKDFVVERVKQWLRESPGASIVSVSQNDGEGACQCAKCQALAREEGSEAGPLLHFVNYVAEKIEPEFPNVAVDTLAYKYTRKPPLHVRPRPNVIVRLCSHSCDFARPLGESDSNKTFREDIEGWSKVCNQLYVWDYTTNFAHFFAPHPNYYVLGPNVKFFVDHGARGVFEQGASSSVGAEMAELRAWMLAKLLWNPERDPKALMSEFLAGYFEDAAPPIRQYMDLVYDECIRTDHYLTCSSQINAAFLSLDLTLKAEKLFDQAEAAVVGKPDVLFRVKVARLPIMYLRAVRWFEFREEARRRGMQWPDVAEYEALCQSFLNTAGQRGVTMISEGRGLDAFPVKTVELERKPSPPPPGCENLPADAYQDLQDTGFSLAGERVWASRETDPAASDGVAARMPGDHYQWAIQQPLGLRIVADNPGVTFKVFASIRVEKVGNEGDAMTFGVYDEGQGARVGGGTVKAGDIADDQYHAYEVVTAPLTGSMFIWVAPAKNPENVKAVWVDRFWLVKQ